jgi:peptidyl-prolyl cis-trans isomerase SurA
MNASLRLIAALTLASALTSPIFAAPTPLDRIVALVNEDIILQTELNQKLKQAQANLTRQGIDPSKIARLDRQVLNQMIGEHIQLQRAKQMGLRIDDRALNAQLTQMAGRNNMGLEAFAKAIENQLGVPFVRYREEIRQQMLLDALQAREVLSRIQISDVQVEDFLKGFKNQGKNLEYRLSHILLSLPSGGRTSEIEAVKKKALALANQARGGQSFAQLAISHSESSTALSGGSIGWQSLANLPEDIAQKIAPLAAGEISPPIHTSSGVHLFKVEELRNKDAILEQQTRARHILVAKKPGLTEQAGLEKIQRLRAQLIAGEDFARLAKEFSDDPGSGSRGGDLGWLKPGETVAEFEQAMNALKIEAISPVIESQFGWHLIQVLERRKQDVTDQARLTAARAQMIEQKSKDEIELWLKRLRDGARIEVRL